MMHFLTSVVPEVPSWSLNPGVPFGRFEASIPLSGFQRIEATVPRLDAPNDSFRQTLIGILWRFYTRSREADAMVNRAVIKEKLQNALEQAAALKTSIEHLAKSQERAVTKALIPFAGMVDEHDQHPAGQHPSGIGLIVVLDHFERDMKRAGRSLRRETRGRQQAVAFIMLTQELSQWQRRWDHKHTDGSWFEFLKAIVDVLREMESTLQKEERELELTVTRFKLPNGPDSLRRSVYPRHATRGPRREKGRRDVGSD